MKIVTPEQMKAMDLRTVQEGVFTSLRLMQNAAEALYQEVTLYMQEHGFQKILLLAGPGNNGGDAYALACLLYPAYQPAVLPVGGEDRSPDCAYYYQKAKELGVPFVTEPTGYPLVADGVFGTGFHGELPAEVQALFAKIQVPVVAIDLPSGMNGNSGVCSAGTLQPELTVTFAFKKPCHLLANCGRVVLADIGIPKRYADAVACSELTPVLPYRSAWGHKNSYGTVGLRVGAPAYPGAAALAITGALQSGAGLVYGYLPHQARAAAAAKLYGPVLCAETELMPLQCNAYLVGSGLGRTAEAAADVKSLWLSNCPLVVDGDGLFHLKEFLAPRNAVTVLTPHMGEFSRLTGLPVEQIQQNRLQIAQEFALKYQVILVLKDAATVVTDGTCTEVLSAPCSALAKGGSGDLLAGLIAGLIAGNASAFDMAKTGVYLHNRAGHLAAKDHSVRSLQPEQIAQYINNAWMELEHGVI